ncbi:hypothetical protein BDF22DRAFT_687379 [Syncephalis plumigaleata]|nr:hypothetical protein BDF22DRAFT_687379 [Syncephalis plumigaleata]
MKVSALLNSKNVPPKLPSKDVDNVITSTSTASDTASTENSKGLMLASPWRPPTQKESSKYKANINSWRNPEVIDIPDRYTFDPIEWPVRTTKKAHTVHRSVNGVDNLVKCYKSKENYYKEKAFYSYIETGFDELLRNQLDKVILKRVADFMTPKGYGCFLFLERYESMELSTYAAVPLAIPIALTLPRIIGSAIYNMLVLHRAGVGFNNFRSTNIRVSFDEKARSYVRFANFDDVSIYNIKEQMSQQEIARLSEYMWQTPKLDINKISEIIQYYIRLSIWDKTSSRQYNSYRLDWSRLPMYRNSLDRIKIEIAKKPTLLTLYKIVHDDKHYRTIMK